MTIKESFIDAPALMTTSDLIKYGLYPSRAALQKARERGNAPPAIYLSERAVRFPKSELISWLESKARKAGSVHEKQCP